MENQHLTYFKVENFKRFSSLELNDIGQFNIIVGDNNTGKTSLLEALLVDGDDLSPLYVRLKQRVPSFSNQEIVNISPNLALKYFLNKDAEIKKIVWRLNETVVNFSDGKVQYIEGEVIPFVGLGGFYDKNFEGKYSLYIQKSVKKKAQFTNDLKVFIPDISYIDLSVPYGTLDLLIAELNSDVTSSIGKYGEGVSKLARMLVDIQMFSTRRLMIDEVEAGIHWSRYKVFWKTILRAALDADTQLFMTTHDSECLKYLIQAVEEEPELASVKEKLRLIELRERTTDREIAPVVRGFDAMSHYITIGREVRGGHLVK